MKYIYTITFLLLHIGLSAQNWSLFNLNQKSYYQQENSIETINLDSIKIVGETETHYFNRKLGLSDECYQSILENTFIADSNLPGTHYNLQPDSLCLRSDTVFIIIEDYFETDTFIFKPHINVGESWFTTNSQTKISCVSAEFQEVLGVQDSVKTFSVLEGEYSGATYVLSKSFGLVSFIPFQELKISNGNFNSLPFKLLGYKTDSESVGYSEPGFEDYFHLQAGDVQFFKEFHDEYNNPEESYTRYYKDSITYSYLSSDSVYYNMVRTRYDANGVFVSQANTYSIVLEKWYQDVIAAPTNSLGYFMYMNSPHEVFRTLNYTIEQGDNENDTVSSFGYFTEGVSLSPEDCSADQIYCLYGRRRCDTRNGRVLSVSDGYSYYEDILIGSINNGVTYGIPAIPVSVSEVRKAKFKIYPNPTSGKLCIDSDFDITKVTVTDVSGKIILETHQGNIELSNQQPGIYFVKIETKEGVFVEKLIIK